MSQILTRLPSHRMYVELLSGNKMNLMRKIPKYSELYNDQRGLIFDFFKVLREDADTFKNYIINNNTESIENNNIVTADRWKELRDLYLDFKNECIEGNLNSCTGFRDVTPEVESEILSIDTDLLYMVKRLRMVQYENRDYTDLINRFDKIDTVFYVDVSRLGDVELTPKELCFNLLKVKGKCIIYGVDESTKYDVLVDEGWVEVVDDVTQEKCWLNYRI